LPRRLRARLALGIARDLVKASYGGSRARVRVRSGRARVEIHSSIFCGVREQAAHPLCGFYAAAFERVLTGLGTNARAEVSECRGAGGTGCRIELSFAGRPLEQPASRMTGTPAGEVRPASEGT
jgi:hypothetical protein